MTAKLVATLCLCLAASAAAQASVEISSAPTSNVNCTGGVCTPTAKMAVLNTGDLATMLAAGDVTVTTGNGAQTITVVNALTWANASRLTLDADLTVSFKAALVVEGPGALTITYDGGKHGAGDLLFFPGGHADFWDLSSSLVILGRSYRLIPDVDTLARDLHVNPDGRYALAADFDSAGRVYKHSPMPDQFHGAFEGLGHTIANFKLRAAAGTTRTQFGLFLVNAGTIRDLALTGAQVQTRCQGQQVAALVATNWNLIRNVSVGADVSGGTGSTSGEGIGAVVGDNKGTVANAHSSGSVKDCNDVSSTDLALWAGGLVGENDGTVTASDSSSTLEGGLAGGLVGANAGTIQNSHASGTVTVGDVMDIQHGQEAGGLSGTNSGTILQSYATGAVTGGNGMLQGSDAVRVLAGGLTAVGVGSIEQSFATGSVHTGDLSYAGGLGAAFGGTMQDSYATGAVAAGADSSGAGGLIGWAGDSARVTASYSTGAVSFAAPGARGSRRGVAADLGGFLGVEDGASVVLKHDIWDTDTSGVTDLSKGVGNIAGAPGVNGRTTAALQAGLPTGFDAAVWGEKPSINNGLPYLLANPPE
jgi:hypothetical protein